MNSLSWMIYVADCVGGLGKIATIFTVASLVASVAGLIMAGPISWEFYGDEEKAMRTNGLALLRKGIVGAFICSLLVCLIPSTSTIYAIAASEYGEDVLKTPEASKARVALNAWLDKQIEQKPEKAK